MDLVGDEAVPYTSANIRRKNLKLASHKKVSALEKGFQRRIEVNGRLERNASRNLPCSKAKAECGAPDTWSQ